jgi:uncharacterized membrane protein YeaQ/YmgE (transglycosylase-associated protein family)
MDILWFIIIGIIAGWLAGLIIRGHGFGLVGNLITGVVGALLGGMIFRAVGLEAYGTMGAIIMATIGATVFLGLTRIIKHA